MRFTVVVGFLTLIVANLAQAVEVDVANVWLRESIPGSENGAAYFTITNQQAEIVRLVGATTDAARAVEVHEHVMRVWYDAHASCTSSRNCTGRHR